MKLQLLAAVIVAAGFLIGSAQASAATAAPAISLPNCVGKAIVKPSSVILTCADAGLSVSHISWTGWGSAFAAGLGVASVNDCKPYCAAGHFHNFRVVLIAGGRQRCPDGRAAYAKVTYAWIGRAPYSHGDPDPVVPFPCRR
ncbi:MAG TPA: hypothetical protein VMV73_05270 [Candidatus Dormibacteraeota bacterium]|nr:hypothetical protein [Candidatus Dormibacteraeota bacterium]